MYARNLESIVNNIDIRALTLAKYVQFLSPPLPPSYEIYTVGSCAPDICGS